MTLGTQKVRKNAQFWSEHFLLRTASAALAADAGSQDLEGSSSSASFSTWFFSVDLTHHRLLYSRIRLLTRYGT